MEQRGKNTSKEGYGLSPNNIVVTGKELAAKAIRGKVPETEPIYVERNGEKKMAMSALKARIPLMLMGGPSNGKTTLVEHLASKGGPLDADGVPLLKVPCHGMRLPTLIGNSTIQLNEPEKYIDGPLSLAGRSGVKAIVYFDEAIEMPKDIWNSLSEVLDHRKELTLTDTMESIDMSNVLVVLALNQPTAVEGGDKLPTWPTISRFVAIRFPDIKYDDFGQILDAKYSNLKSQSRIMDSGFSLMEAKDRYLEKILAVCTVLTSKEARKDIDDLLQVNGRYTNPTLRQVENALALIANGLDPKSAIMMAIVYPMTPFDDPRVENTFLPSANAIIMSKLGRS